MIDEVKRSNKTARANGAVGNPVVAKWAKTNLPKGESFKVLDFGSGPAMKQTLEMRSLGFNVDAWDFGDNKKIGMVETLKNENYDFVLASNVFNTHSNEEMSIQALNSIKNTLKAGGSFIFNMPSSPVYFWKDKKAFLNLVQMFFGENPKLAKEAKNVYIVKKP